MDNGQEDTHDDHNDSRDIRDLEFSLANNIKQLRSRACSLSDREIQLVKLVLCSSLYPQLAIGDEHNPYRKSNEIVFQVPGWCPSYLLFKVETDYIFGIFSKELFVYSS